MELRRSLGGRTAGIVRVSAGPIGLVDDEVVEVEHFDACRRAGLERVEMDEVRGVVDQEKGFGTVETHRTDRFLRGENRGDFWTFLRFRGSEPLSSRRENSASFWISRWVLEREREVPMKRLVVRRSVSTSSFASTLGESSNRDSTSLGRASLRI